MNYIFNILSSRKIKLVYLCFKVGSVVIKKNLMTLQ